MRSAKANELSDSEPKDTKAQRHQERPHKRTFDCGLSWCLCAFVSTRRLVRPRFTLIIGKVVGGRSMKANIHPNYVEAVVKCACGETFRTRSTKPEIHLEICSKCHPFFTGKQKLVDTAGRVERFQRKYRKTT